ncbi:MAG: diaminopimelate epimerase [Candidatus Omnitrophica bacterium]|nr:diaminopimelate epimerase [Candidatus Omnitrophota bacterium]MBU1784290.1 diaminopimelate epimerase [Candidatus Omnitrophota bacterium]MBU1852276.1 diaminopimelate epimerase [Candidatus Omnitrophota bacterium]
MRKKYDIHFTKAVASGNDFVIIDDKDGRVKKRGLNYGEMARDICRRHASVGADGVLILEGATDADLRMRVINPDGTEVDMCGNGARCSAFYAARKGWGTSFNIETGAGMLCAEVNGNRVRLKMSAPTNAKLAINLGLGDSMMNVNFINSGVPHVVHFVKDIENYPVVETGRRIREHSFFSPGGTNVNFVGEKNGDEFPIRTYERGVEDETLACGTGSVASALVLGLIGGANSPIKMRTKSGEILTVHYEIAGQKIQNVYLEGSADIVYEGGL